ncbi:hypothetical protein chiPu_0020361 [Chiloscyllium punctatum]|uniref:Ig-like domain-containing protein n=1 Tax=Chiloscyllium punctatum TaxID=137246 RepID=A0A401RET6_CHIPU|nr:hypothetical protein [Chiloscyllium punctatum]
MNIFLFSCLLTWLPNVFTAWVEQTPRTLTKETGESLTINCVLKDASYALRGTSWYLTKLNATTWSRISIGGRYSETVNKGLKSFSLRIRDLRVEDSGAYHCEANVDHSNKPDLPPRQQHLQIVHEVNWPCFVMSTLNIHFEAIIYDTD